MDYSNDNTTSGNVGAEDGGVSSGQARALLLQEEAEKKRRGWRIVFVIALVVLVASLTALGVIAFSYFQGQQKYGEVAKTADFDPDEVKDGALGEATVDWDALLAVNPDTVGWVYVPNTVINYPIVQGQDNDHYLTYDFDGNEGWLAEYGAVFLDYRNNREWRDNVSFVYGHHMNDGSMFADIANMRDQTRFDASRTVYLLTPKGNFRLRSFSLIHCASDDPIVVTNFEKREEMTEYVQDMMNRSVVEVGDVPKASDINKVFAFSTCDDYSSGRYVLFAYVEDTTAEGLVGDVGLEKTEDGQTDGWANGLSVEE